MFKRGISLIAVVAVFAAACTSGGASAVPTVGPSTAPTSAASAAGSEAPSTAASVAPVAGGLLDKVLKAGKLVIATDKDYAPQSFLSPDGKWTGFDVAVATEIAKRLGVTPEFHHYDWAVITAGRWASRFDISVGSMTITGKRQKILDFTTPYYFTPAQMTATTKSGITSLDGLAGKTVCVGVSTTYEDWLKGQFDSVSLGPVATPPAGVKVKTEPTDANCAEFIKSGRDIGEGFLTSSTTADSSIKNGTPVVKIGEPVFVEQLAASADKSGPPTADFIAAVSKIIDDMHADGTLTKLSNEWFKQDLTTKPAG
jgi:polar amino acid transport system substrate-binding protein